jgi:DNA-binding XRE family transcriptional regulator
MRDQFNIYLGIAIKKARCMKMLRQGVAAEKAGISRWSLCNIENARVTIPLPSLRRISKALDKKASEIIASAEAMELADSVLNKAKESNDEITGADN